MIHVITGPPCGGKSTYVSKNAQAGDLKIDYDALAQALGAADSHAAEGLIRKAAFDARNGAIDRALKNPAAESWIIHTSPTEERLKQYQEAGADVVKLDPGYDECITRAKRDGRPQQTFDGIEKYYSGQKGKAMGHLYKNFELKADADAGTISGYFSTYDRIPDSYGDVIAPGAFTDTIKARKESGHPFPLCWNHDLDQIIGAVDPDNIKDTEKGPHMVASFFSSPLAQEKREIVKSGVVYQFSFAYDVLDAGPVTLEDGTKANELRKLDLFEVSIVPIPANQNAVMTEVKSEEPEEKEIGKVVVKVVPEIDENALSEVMEKAGRRNSKADADKLQQAVALIQEVLGQLDDTEAAAVEGEDEAKDNAAAEDPERSNPAKAALLETIKALELEG